MGKVIWSPTAEKDVDLIAEYIARDSIDRAALFYNKGNCENREITETSSIGSNNT